jgi:hypothetical protein
MVTENPAGSGTEAVDGCHFACSSIDRYTEAAISGHFWKTQSNSYAPDLIGYGCNLDAYYSKHKRTPCTMQVKQHMKIRCKGFCEYSVNLFEIKVGLDKTFVSRGGTRTKQGH